MRTITGKVVGIKRHGHTKYGNPKMSITLDTDDEGVWHRISNDAGIVYAIENREFRKHAHTFEVTKAGLLNGVSVRASLGGA